MTLKKQTANRAGRSKAAKARKSLTRDQLFFYENAGYSYDPKTETSEQGRIRGAIALAEAKEHAWREGWTYSWEMDDQPYEDCLGDHAYWCDKAKAGVRHRHEVVCCVLYDINGKVRGSLGAIIDPSPEYCRVVKAELALEAM